MDGDHRVVLQYYAIAHGVVIALRFFLCWFAVDDGSEFPTILEPGHIRAPGILPTWDKFPWDLAS